MIYITEEKLKAAIQICLGSNGIYTKEIEDKLVHDIKALSIADVVGRSEQLLEEQTNWLMANTSLEVEKIVDFKEHFKLELITTDEARDLLLRLLGMCEHDYVRLAHTTFVKCSKCGKVMKHWEVKHYR